jgi:transmembrane sensor
MRDEEIRALAAAWLARIRADNARGADRQAFQAWLDEDERHREAFAAVTAMWETAGALHTTVVASRRVSRRSVTAGLAVLAASLVLAVMGVLLPREDTPPPAIHVTSVGEQLRIPLPDGSTAVLDTSTELRVQFTSTARTVELVRGRAFVDVAHDPAHPFIVQAGSRQVVAVGTAFNVARSDLTVEVVLINGKVRVEDTGNTAQSLAIALEAPGEFASLSASGEVRRGRTSLERETAWQMGKIVFDDEPLDSAIAQMNRYSLRPILLGDSALREFRISGIYSVGNIEAFATSISILWPIEVTLERAHILVTRKTAGTTETKANSPVSRLR